MNPTTNTSFSVTKRIMLLALPILWAIVTFTYNASDTDRAELLGYVTAPFLLGIVLAGIVWGVAKLFKPHKKPLFKLPFIDHAIVYILAFALLNVISRLGQAGQQ